MSNFRYRSGIVSLLSPAQSGKLPPGLPLIWGSWHKCMHIFFIQHTVILLFLSLDHFGLLDGLEAMKSDSLYLLMLLHSACAYQYRHYTLEVL